MHRLKPNEITKITRRRTGMRTYCKTKSWDCDNMSIKITGKPLIIMDADRPDNILVHRRRQWTKVTSIFIHHVPVRRRLGHSFTINGEAYMAIMSLRTIGETRILSLTPHKGITDTALKPPLKHLQWLEGRSKHIYTNTPRPGKVRKL